MIQSVAVQVVAKYLRKGNMARCLRDILPRTRLSKEQREEVADIVHSVVRWKRLYEHLSDLKGLRRSAETYVKLAREGVQADAAAYPFEYRYSCSSFVADVFKTHEEWAEYLNRSPPTTLCVNLNKTSVEEVCSLLQKESFPVERSNLPTAVRTTSVSKYSKVVQEHYAHVQDESSQLVSYLIASLGDSLFDFCAGNGGKSLALASLTQNSKKLSAYELNALKRTTLRQRCREYAAEVVVEDSVPNKQFDVVLVDAPCTGLGAARRNPEVKYIDSVGILPETQLSLLIQAASNVKTGGFLIYAVCTMTLEETTKVIETFQEKHSFTLYVPDEFIYKKFLRLKSNGYITVLPQGDVFFLSLLKKTGE
jgi:16S rRNA (cytosine967-C5)-methyltransferase